MKFYSSKKHRQHKPFWGISAIILGEEVTESSPSKEVGEGHTRQIKTHHKVTKCDRIRATTNKNSAQYGKGWGFSGIESRVLD